MALYKEFLEGLWADPRAVSAPMPSSDALSAAIAAKVNPFVPGLVVELGAGTGAITAALLARGIGPERLVAVESNARFCGLLRTRFPKIRVFCGDALKFDTFLEPAERIAAIVSGLPLLHLVPAVRRDLISRAFDRQGPHGRFIQLSYGWRPAISGGEDFSVSKHLVWRNFPPANIWTYTKAAHATAVRRRTNLAPRLA